MNKLQDKTLLGGQRYFHVFCVVFFLKQTKMFSSSFFFLFSCVVSFHHVSASSEMMPVILGRIVVF